MMYKGIGIFAIGPWIDHRISLKCSSVKKLFKETIFHLVEACASRIKLRVGILEWRKKRKEKRERFSGG